ncbi:hypothetical protein [Thermoactinomyces sp. DSM 45892]|uniref:hypothetical protein n=1 Tax=Thermoactinomyces sp. DSM 45892 TaxID=1882753 RepID=UPI00089C0B20|nr:hypothetical protein [Thermoactinomyces sp. DSM 45892]SDZ23473.1 hypothetical protein SAMN05444416_11721 [Thermoactinomyces sp. DSM 45892]
MRKAKKLLLIFTFIISVLSGVFMLSGQASAKTISANNLPINNIHFMQSTAKNKTGDYTVLDNAVALKEGTLKPEELPQIRVWRDKDKKIWTLDHRRLIAFKLAGIKNVSVRWATEDEIKHDAFKMTTPNGGEAIDLLCPNSKTLTVKRAEDYSVWSLEYLKQIRSLYQG